MHLFTWFFLLWPLATLYYHLGLSNSLYYHWGHNKSSNTAVSLTTLLYYHCWFILSLILYNSCEILSWSWLFFYRWLKFDLFWGLSFGPRYVSMLVYSFYYSELILIMYLQMTLFWLFLCSLIWVHVWFGVVLWF